MTILENIHSEITRVKDVKFFDYNTLFILTEDEKLFTISLILNTKLKIKQVTNCQKLQNGDTIQKVHRMWAFDQNINLDSQFVLFEVSTKKYDRVICSVGL